MTDDEIPVSFLERVEASTEYKDLVERGVEARKAGDLSNWELGDLAIAVVAEAKRVYQAEEHDSRGGGYYGKQVLKRYAETIGIDYGALTNYRWVAERYEKLTRVNFPALGYSHFYAVGAREDREELLQQAQDGGWTVRALEDELARQAGKETSGERELDRILDMGSKTPYEAILEIVRLLEGHAADRGVQATIESFNKEETLPQLRATSIGRMARALKYLYQLHEGMAK